MVIAAGTAPGETSEGTVIMGVTEVLDDATPIDGDPAETPASDGTDGASGPFTPSPARARKLGAVLTLVGSVTIATAVVGAQVLGGASRAPEPPVPGRPAASGLTTVVDASTVRTNGPVDLVVQSVTYGPGASSGWHSHPGLHLVSILSGTLTVYGPDCQPQTFTPGVPYFGGGGPHVARNETDAPLEMAVTYVTRPGQSMQHFRTDASAPAGCDVS